MSNPVKAALHFSSAASLCADTDKGCRQAEGRHRCDRSRREGVQSNAAGEWE